MGLLTLMIVGLVCAGEPFTIDWSTLDGGGGEREAHRQNLVENGILNPDFTPNEATAAMMGWTLRDPEPEDLMAETALARAQPAEESEVNGARK